MFQIIHKGQYRPSVGVSSVYLKVDHWNDYSFVTLFDLSLHDEQGELREVGSVKIGFVGQTTAQPTYELLPPTFERLEDGFFSLGQSVEFYKNMASLSPALRLRVLKGLNDIVSDPTLISRVEDEKVLGVSLLRMVSLSEVKGQFARVLQGAPELTDFSFSFLRADTERMGGLELPFEVVAQSTPSTNIHALIGRNGVGKTTVLNGMIQAVTCATPEAQFVERSAWGVNPIPRDYFSSLVSVSFSAFDPFEPPPEQPDPSKGACYFYIGLKGRGAGAHRGLDEMQRDCTRYLAGCFASRVRSSRWLRAIDKLGSDENFASMGLSRLKDAYDEVRTRVSSQADSTEFNTAYFEAIRPFLCRMSSGHAIVLLTTTFLVAKVEEKTLVLLDEPESHLHPPLLSAFLRALSELLHDRNGVAIVATHSPVVLQEIPKSCVWKVTRTGTSVSKNRPRIETFGENVGFLTSEVFSLEVERSGFHSLLAKDVGAGKEYDQVIAEYKGQLGLEGRAVLRALIADRDSRAVDVAPE